MPPRKKAKASAASTPLADVQPKTPQDAGPTAEQEQLNDAWADEQETQLFKSMMKWKPTGIHKHFRIISIHADLRSHGFAADDTPHTRIPAIWSKVASLYDLRALDEREDAYTFSDDPDPLDPDEALTIPDFELPEDEFGAMVWERRFHGPDSEASSSPPTLATDDEKLLYVPDMGLLKDQPDGILSQLTESAAEATPASKRGKGTRPTKGAAKGAKTARGQAAKNTKAQSAVSDSAEEEEDEDEDEEESSSESEEDTAPSTRRTNRNKGKAQPAPKRTRKR
ncbi:CT20-domain-containing protein [Karstenula rhodostoma CBS 690.94]|uniref:CT20-domain-containing protein n=1 Tax=Karstenula rhodostoma CBS 690.94 TaxID=1392251 RepID=A0A9P4PXC4_9PLEO|nr:CT20-domain-containing protein [Karstenula rhodostoma CBS 690.94]